MTQTPIWLALFWQFFLLSCISIGGANTVLPDVQRYVVEEHAWISDRQFADLYALAQAAPGPNALWVTLIGLQIDGWRGAAATTLALLIPSTALSFVAVALHTRHPHSVLGIALRRGLAPIAVGLMFVSGWLLLRSASEQWQGYALTLVAFIAVLRTRFNPLWLIAAGAASGVAGFV
jgi:chromate transporter